MFYAKRNILFHLFTCFAVFIGIAQKDYKGRIVDAETGEVIPYVNIGIVEKGIGTVSDEEGLFHLYFNRYEIDKSSKILFSALGYASLNIPVAEMPLVYNEYPVFKMQPERVALNEVVVSNKGERFITDFVGYKNYGEKTFGYWKDQIALGGELATRIIAKKGLRRLERLQFEVFSNPSDSLLLRVNIYEDDGSMGRPMTNLNTSSNNILVTVKKDDKIVWVDLKPFDIYVNDDFYTSLELVKVYGDKELGLILAAAFIQYGSYRRYASQDKWERIADQSMAYYLESQYMVSERIAERFEKRERKRKDKQRIITGFAISKGKMIPSVQILNRRTKKTTMTGEDGRYQIAAEKDDILEFSRKGYKTLFIEIKDKPTANVLMKLTD